MKNLNILVVGCLFLMGCENKSLSEGEEFRPREIHEEILFHFDPVTVDGVEYLILEKDNNNPHEGFGFMALRGNRIFAKQDTITAYLKTISDMQVKIYARIERMTDEDAMHVRDDLFQYHLKKDSSELEKLRKEVYSGRTSVVTVDSTEKIDNQIP